MSRSPLVLAVLGALLAAGSCGGRTPTEDGGYAAIVEREVLPSETSPQLGVGAPNLVWLDTARQGAPTRLLLLLSGTGGAPGNARLFGREGAHAGYATVGLTYPNDLAVVVACSGDPAPDCMGRMREETVEGGDRSPHVSVDTSGSITGRLVALLRWLDARHPAEGWGAFLDGDAPRWSAIAVGGLSQGGGHAAWIATRHEVPRVIMFGAPADGYDGRPAEWTMHGATPADRWYGLAHERDPFASIPANWRQLGMAAFGDESRVERTAPPYGGSHMLRTDLLPRTGSYANAHPSVYADGATPRAADGTPVLLPAWRYLLGDGR